MDGLDRLGQLADEILFHLPYIVIGLFWMVMSVGLATGHLLHGSTNNE